MADSAVDAPAARGRERADFRLKLSLVIYAVRVPMLIGFTVARYDV
jgi:hypothetical protein